MRKSPAFALDQDAAARARKNVILEDAMAAPLSLDPAQRMLGELFSRHAPAGLAPGMDVIERGDELIVRAALPGVKKEDIEISVSGTLLTLRCASREARTEEQGEYYCRELPRGAISRALVLPAEVDESKAQATLKDGILELRLPKPEALRRRRIRID